LPPQEEEKSEKATVNKDGKVKKLLEKHDKKWK
jgi:hypothetical protein